MSEPVTALITLERKQAVAVFTGDGELDPILDRIAKEVRAFIPDITTAKGRKEIASMAYKVAQSKSALDSVGKQLADEYKEIPKRIDANRKAMRDFLDSLRDEVRAPLAEWEAEQERIEQEKAAALEAERIAHEIEAAHEIALLMNAAHDAEQERRREREAAERAERDRQIAAEAEARAREEAEAKVIAARLDAERAQRARIEAEEKAERERAESEERAQRAAREAVERERAEAEERARREAEETARREADVAHRKAKNREALAGLVSIGLTDEQGKTIIKAIIDGKIPNIKLHY